MKKTKVIFLSLPLAVLLAGCAFGKANAVFATEPEVKVFDLKEVSDTSMLTSNCKAYIDAMRSQEDNLEDPYKISDLGGEAGIQVENFLDQGEVEGQNRTVSGQIPNRSDRNEGVNLSFTVAEGFESSEYKVLVSKNNNFEDAKEYTTSTNSINVKNLFVNTQYYWKVVGGNYQSNVGTFKTGDYPRWISARPLYNVRDNGGYMTDSGRRVKQGLIFRGGEITTSTQSGHYNTIADSSKEAFRNEMHIGVELDLRGPSDISDGYNKNAFAENNDIEYQQYAIKSYEQTFTQTRSMVAPIFEILKNADQKPVYYHCFGGADRTGTIGFLLNGILGVSYTDLVIDFELTSYSSINNEHIRSHIPGHEHQYDRWPALINQIKTDTTGGYAYNQDVSLKENLEEFLTKACNVPMETIETIREIMIEPEKQEEEPAPKKGCGASIMVSSPVLALVALAGCGVFALRKKEEK